MVGQQTNSGRVRDQNEDRVYVCQPTDPQQNELRGRLFVIADGMGGHEAGAVAADLATHKVPEEYYYGDPTADVPDALARAIRVANSAIRDLAVGDSAWSNMGTTCVAAVLQGNRLVVANVGDSRAYLVRDGQIRQITKDHSWVAEEVEAGRLDAKRARSHPKRNLLTRSVGTRPDVEVDPFEETIALDDAVVLCSDGLHNLVSDAEIARAVGNYGPQDAADELVQLALQRGAPDNVSVVVVGPPRSGRPGHGRFPSHSTLVLAGGAAILAIVAFVVAIGFANPAVTPSATVKANRSAALPVPNAASKLGTKPSHSLASATATVAPAVLVLTPANATSAPTGGIAAGQPTATLAPFASPTKEQPVAVVVEATPSEDTPGKSGTTAEPTRTSTPVTILAPPTSTPLPPAPSPTAVPVVGTLSLDPPQAQPGQIVLVWGYSEQLEADQVFDLLVWKTGEVPHSIANVKPSEPMSHVIGGNFPTGTYNWMVAVFVPRTGETISRSSPGQPFTWNGTGGQGGGGGGTSCHTCP